MTNLPRIAGSQIRLHPSSMSVTLSMTPLHTAEMELLPDESVALRDLIEVFTPNGSAGYFRVTGIEKTFGDVSRVSLDHSLCTLNDSLLQGEAEKESSARAAAEEILAAQTDPLWALGRVDYPDDQLITWSYNNSGLLDSLLDLMAELHGYTLTFDQSVTPWIVNIERLSDEDACECRLHRNLTSLTMSTDASQLCTRLYVPGREAPLDADTIDRWGVITRVLDADEDLGEEALLQEAERFLDTYKHPLLTVTMDALDLHRATGEPFDRFHPGRMCRVAVPEWGETIRQRVASVTWPDVYGDEEVATVTLSREAPDAAAQLAGLVVDTTILRRTVTKNAKDGEKERIQLRTNLETVERGLKQQATATNNRVDTLANRIEDAEDNIDHSTETLKLLDGVTAMTADFVVGGLRVVPAYQTITFATPEGGSGRLTAVTSITVTGGGTEKITYLGK